LLEFELQQLRIVSCKASLNFDAVELGVAHKQQIFHLLFAQLLQPILLVRLSSALPRELQVNAVPLRQRHRPRLVLRMDRKIDDAVC
jgi:hypothetical protein